jgi:hypothetical protein
LLLRAGSLGKPQILLREMLLREKALVLVENRSQFN